MSGYIGTQPVPQATQTRDSFVATGGQTSFATSGYTPGFLDVYLNGVHLVYATDYTAANGSDVILAVAATASDVVEVVAFTAFEVSNTTPRTSPTGSSVIPTGTEAQRDGSPAAGYLRFNTTDTSFEGYDGSAWGSIGGGATDDVIYENAATITTTVTIVTGRNGMSAGPITIDGGSVTIESGSRWVVI